MHIVDRMCIEIAQTRDRKDTDFTAQMKKYM